MMRAHRFVWLQVRQGSMLGLKYALAVCASSTPGMAERALPVLMAAMEDGDDDVRAAAVHACVPLATAIAAQPAATVRGICDRLWALLPSFDEVSPAPASVMQLLGLLCSQVRQEMGPATASGDVDASVEDEAEDTVHVLHAARSEPEDVKPSQQDLDLETDVAMHGIDLAVPESVDLLSDAEVRPACMPQTHQCGRAQLLSRASRVMPGSEVWRCDFTFCAGATATVVAILRALEPGRAACVRCVLPQARAVSAAEARTVRRHTRSAAHNAAAGIPAAVRVH